MKRLIAPLLILALLAGCKVKPHSLADAQKCLHNQDLACAADNLQGYLALKPEDMHATGLLAIILTQSGRHGEALPLYKKAVDGGIKDDQLYANYAGSLEATGDKEGAIAWNRKALELNPTLVDVAMATASLLNEAGRPAEGVEVLEAFDAHQVAGGHPAKFPPVIAVLKENIPDAGAAPAKAPHP